MNPNLDMQTQDAHDRFTEICHNSDEYPQVQLRKQEPHEALFGERQYRSLQERECSLFDRAASVITFWETGRRNQFPNDEEAIWDMETLWSHLHRSDQDPHVRHVFVSADNSRSPLSCSMDMFKLVCTYHQVNPSFLEPVHAFGRQTEPLDLCLAQFKGSDTLDCLTEGLPELPKIGRSGREIQLSYLLRSVESSESGKGVWDWQIRQVANYHSFDVETGRAFWFTVKADDVFEDRIKKTSPLLRIPAKAETQDGDVSLYLQASLATHLVYLCWCDENWRQFINETEAGIRAIVTPASKAIVDDLIDRESSLLSAYPKPLRDSRSQTMYSQSQSMSGTLATTIDPEKNKMSMLSRMANGTSSTLSSWLRQEKSKQTDPELGGHCAACPTDTSPPPPQPDTWEVLNQFRFKDVQTLHKHSEIIHRASLALELDMGVLNDICTFYSHTAATEFRGKVACEGAISNFIKEVQSIARRLETRLQQMRCLAITLGQSIQLYERLLQQRTSHIGNWFAEIAHENTKQMQVITDKTLKETTSMHVITIATLIFLPATFVATFFQSGVLLWKEDGADDMTRPFIWKRDSLMLFLSFCGPLTAATIGGWLFMYVRLRKSTRRKL
ncbi:serine/threonine protein kinase [Colletotrichum scovillei]|nr:serine/threonine protein kinase [Colletotrichum scovillei]